MTPRVLVIVNSASSGPRRLGTWLREKAIDVDEIVGAEQPLPTSLDGYAGLVMLGGVGALTNAGENMRETVKAILGPLAAASGRPLPES